LTSAAAYAEANEWATYWARHWFIDENGADSLTIDGLEVGWATHVEAYQLLLDFALQTLGEPTERAAGLGRLKALGFDRAIRDLGLQLIPGRWAPSVEPGGVALIVEVPTTSMLEPIRLVANELPPRRRHVMSMDPRAVLALWRDGVPVRALGLPVREQLRLRRLASTRFGAILSRANRSAAPMILDGQDVAPQARRRLLRSLRRSAPWLAVEHAALERGLDEARPDAIAIASDQHRIGRLVVQIAARLHVPVTVLQHGLPQAELGYLPVVADHVAAWSASSIQWFVERGSDPSRFVVMGNPRIDALSVDRVAASRDRAQEDGTRLLLALSPNARSINTNVVSAALAALAQIPAARLVVKLHPGHREWSWVRGMVRAAPARDRVRVTKHEGVTDLLRWADVTLVHRSTVALESLVAGTPVVILADGPPPELHPLDLACAPDPEALRDAVLQLVDPDSRTRWLEKRTSRIERLAGPLDGRSAERIAALLLGGRGG
jgi:hypothetical protein